MSNARDDSLSSPAGWQEEAFAALVRACGSGDVEAARAAIEEGAPVDAVSRSGRTPLTLAAFWGREAVARHLIEGEHAKVDAADGTGETPFAVACRRGDLALARYLASQPGVNLRGEDTSGATPYVLAKENGHRAVVGWLGPLIGEDGELDDALYVDADGSTTSRLSPQEDSVAALAAAREDMAEERHVWAQQLQEAATATTAAMRRAEAADAAAEAAEARAKHVKDALDAALTKAGEAELRARDAQRTQREAEAAARRASTRVSASEAKARELQSQMLSQAADAKAQLGAAQQEVERERSRRIEAEQRAAEADLRAEEAAVTAAQMENNLKGASEALYREVERLTTEAAAEKRASAARENKLQLHAAALLDEVERLKAELETVKDSLAQSQKRDAKPRTASSRTHGGRSSPVPPQAHHAVAEPASIHGTLADGSGSAAVTPNDRPSGSTGAIDIIDDTTGKALEVDGISAVTVGPPLLGGGTGADEALQFPSTVVASSATAPWGAPRDSSPTDVVQEQLTEHRSRIPWLMLGVGGSVLLAGLIAARARRSSAGAAKASAPRG